MCVCTFIKILSIHGAIRGVVQRASGIYSPVF